MKRGASQIDWIMSLALFLLYIAWFFTFMAPNISFESNKDSLMIYLTENFESEFTWEIEKLPLFIEYNNTIDNLPIILNYTANNTDIEFLDGTQYMLWDNRLIFLADITSDVEAFWLIRGGDYEKNYVFEGINSQQNWTSTGNISVHFEKALPKIVYYKEEEEISNIDYFLNTVEMEPSEKFNDTGFAARYSAQTGNINHTSLIFAHNNRIYNFIEPDDLDSEFILKMEMTLDNYKSYHSNNIYFGDFPYSNNTQNLNYSHDSLTLYGDESITMFFDSDVDFNFTFYNTSLSLEIQIPAQGEYTYKMIFHEGNVSSIEKTDYGHRWGVVQTLEGIYLQNLSQNYSYLKEKWNYPTRRDFNIRVFKNTSKYRYLQDSPLYEIGTFNPGTRNAHGFNEDMYALDKNGDLTRINVNYRIW